MPAYRTERLLKQLFMSRWADEVFCLSFPDDILHVCSRKKVTMLSKA